LTASWSTYSAFLIFGEQERDLQWHTASLAFRAQVSERWSIGASVGGILAGSLTAGDDVSEMRSGWIVGLSGAWRGLLPDGAIPFVDLTLGLSAAGTSLETATDSHALSSHGFNAVDLRLGVEVGWHLFEVWTLYMGARAFGGPVIQQVEGGQETGTDRFHVSAALGSSVRLDNGFLVFVEGVPVFERALTVGIGGGF
jgi:hypothetical protein